MAFDHVVCQLLSLSALLAPGADSNHTLCGIGLNALMYHIDDAGIVDRPLDLGADVNEARSRGETSLHFASSEAVVKLILPRRPDLRTKNLNGQTVSDKARQARREEVARSIERGLSR